VVGKSEGKTMLLTRTPTSGQSMLTFSDHREGVGSSRFVVRAKIAFKGFQLDFN
jgi:hypothetical protein